MNVDDIKSDVIPTDFSETDRLGFIFARQHTLAEKYVEIEVQNGLCHTTDMPVNINDRHGQARLKDFFWRVTEELTEAVDASIEHAHIPVHTIEELADALHFLVETYLLAGADDNSWGKFERGECRLDYLLSLVSDSPSLDHAVYGVIHHLGCASNCLKQRPWKVTHQLTDVNKFYDHLGFALGALLAAFKFCGCSAEDIFAIYWKKSEVNKFRQRSQY
jgi:hypothetical protein